MFRIRSLALVPVCTASLFAQDFHDISRASLAPDSGADWRAVAAGDLDGDGDLDQVFACFGQAGTGDRSFWLRNDGTGSFERMPDSALQMAPSLSRDVVLADFDGDGDLDAFFANQLEDSLCLNDGTGVLSLSPPSLPAINRTSHAAAVGDIDGDGDPDVVCACGGYDIVYLNDGSGVFSEGTTNLPLAWDDTWDVDLADYDGDGDLDLLRVNSDAASELLWNDGAGGFTVANDTLASGVLAVSGDIDGDGDRDFAVTTFGSSFPIGNYYGLQLFRGDGAGQFTSESLWPNPTFFAPQWIAFFDADTDGDLDVAVANDTVLFNDGTGAFTAGASQPQLGYHFADIDGDGDADQIGEPTLRNDGAGAFEAGLGGVFGEIAHEGIAAFCDFDQDGDLDVFVTDVFANLQMKVYANDGRGRFPDLIAQVPHNTTGARWTAADWTGDGYPDLVASYATHVFVNVDGMSLTSVPLPAPVLNAKLVDVDGDSDLDLVGQTTTGALKWHENIAGAFAPPTTVPGLTYSQVMLASDLDGDGREDLLVRPFVGDLLWIRCTGAGVFTPMAGLPANVPYASSAVAADFDGDGDRDLAIGHNFQALQDPRVTLLENDGAGQFSIATQHIESTQISTVVYLHAFDADDDGDADLLAQSSFAGASVLVRNDGSFQFDDFPPSSGPWNGLEIPANVDVHIGDVDRDGDLDVAGGTVLLSNLKRQLLAYEQPTIGTTWSLDVVQRPVGASFGAIVVGLTELAPGVSTPFGTLRIDPLTAVLTPAVAVLQPEPVEAWSLALPNSPSLQGTALFAQHVAVGADGVVLGNQVAVEVR